MGIYVEKRKKAPIANKWLIYVVFTLSHGGYALSAVT